MNRPHFRRRPRPTDPDPEYSRLDRLDGLPQRAAGGTIAAGSTRVIAAGERVYPLDGLPGRTRYDVEWPSVLAAEAPGGDLAAMAAPLPGRSCLGCGYTPPDADTCVVGACVPGYHEVALIPVPGMARDDLGDYAEPVEVVEVLITADVSEFSDTMARFARVASEAGVEWQPTDNALASREWTEPEPVTDGPDDMCMAAALAADAFERIMGDLWGLDRELDAFADGRAYETGSRCRTESAAMKRASEHLADGQDGARRAALVLAGFAGAEAGAV